MTTTTPFKLGSISTGTMRPEDLLVNYFRALQRLDRAKYQTLMDDRALKLPELLGDLEDALQELCPPFVSFGAHPSDGANFGFWPDHGALSEMFDIVPSDFQAGHIYRCGDHPNWPACVVHVDGNDYEQVTVMDLDCQVLWSTV